VPAAEPAPVRTATSADAGTVARLLHDFNTEFAAPTPGVEALTARMGELIERGEATVLLAGEEPAGLAVLRLRPALWSRSLDAYLEELYVVPARRGRGLGCALLEATLEAARQAGAERIDLGTSSDDEVARRLYESAGFTNLENGATMLFYERDL
jgi:ribosomal protein S18 acetylase RimI-like enzyme